MNQNQFLCFAGLVVMARSLNPIPFRTRPLNSSAPMVLCLKTRESRSLPGLQSTEKPNFETHNFSLRCHIIPKPRRAITSPAGFCVLGLRDEQGEREGRGAGRKRQNRQIPADTIPSIPTRPSPFPLPQGEGRKGRYRWHRRPSGFLRQNHPVMQKIEQSPDTRWQVVAVADEDRMDLFPIAGVESFQ
jgi:hypothetical protein